MIDRVVAGPHVRCDGVCYDGAFRGTHIDHNMKHGPTVLSPIHDRTRKSTALARPAWTCGQVQ
jgi:hypothetical protein